MATSGTDAARRAHLQAPGGQQQVSAQPRPAGNQAQATNTMPRQKVESFTGSAEYKALWKNRLLKALEIPVQSRPLEFYDRREAQRFVLDAINDEFDVPDFEDLETGWQWEKLCRETAERLRGIGHIKFPTAQQLWFKEARTARLATGEQGADDNESREAADEDVVRTEEFDAIRAEAHKAGWEGGFERGYSEGYNKAKKEDGIRIIQLSRRLAQKEKESANSTGPSASTQLEASVDKLKFEETPPVSTDQSLLYAFLGGRPGTFAGASGTSESPKHEGSAPSSNIRATAELPFPDHNAGQVIQDAAALSRSSPLPESASGSKLSTTSGPSWMRGTPAGKIDFTTERPSKGGKASTITPQPVASADKVTITPVAEPVDKYPSQYDPGLRKRRFAEGGAECEEFSKSRIPPSVQRFRG
ncbi:hypothetical protein IWZ00DRAFT_546917 [Phyllosticta capitalensis]|uniref:uncharacterized protein n=1 Tax=Phyllosticta capitalensis TaxID=121624 RepID=UPI0031316193